MKLEHKINFGLSMLQSDEAVLLGQAHTSSAIRKIASQQMSGASEAGFFAKNAFKAFQGINVRISYINVVVFNTLLFTYRLVAAVAFTIFGLIELAFNKKQNPLRNVVHAAGSLTGNVVFAAIGVIGLMSPKWAQDATEKTIKFIVKKTLNTTGTSDALVQNLARSLGMQTQA